MSSRGARKETMPPHGARRGASLGNPTSSRLEPATHCGCARFYPAFDVGHQLRTCDDCRLRVSDFNKPPIRSAVTKSNTFLDPPDMRVIPRGQGATPEVAVDNMSGRFSEGNPILPARDSW